MEFSHITETTGKKFDKIVAWNIGLSGSHGGECEVETVYPRRLWTSNIGLSLYNCYGELCENGRNMNGRHSAT